MQDNFIKNCGNLFRLLQSHLSNPSKAMSKESLEENFGECNAVTRYIVPITVVLTIASMTSFLWREEFSLAAMVYQAIVVAISPVLMYFLIRFLSGFVFDIFHIEEEKEKKIQVMTLQLMLLYFAVEFLCALIPGANLLSCLYVYAFYMIWYMAGEYLEIAEHQRIKFMLSVLLVCAVAYIVISLVLRTITPRHP